MGQNKDIVVGHCSFGQNNILINTQGNTVKSFKVKKLNDRVILPEAKWNAAGLDLRVLTEDQKPVIIEPGDFHKFHTGIQIEPPQGEYVRIYMRSSTGCKKHLALMNGTGIIDNDYRGELLVFVWNFGKDSVVVEDNERLCQMVFDSFLNRIPEEVETLTDTERGEQGFGSTGVK